MTQLLHEILGWLGYLQRPAVTLQVLYCLAIVAIRSLPSRQRLWLVPRLLRPFLGPVLLLTSYAIAELFDAPNGLLRFFGLTWLGWGGLQLLDMAMRRVIPRRYAQELRNQLLIPAFITCIALLLIARLDSLQDLAVIEIGKDIDLNIPLGQAFEVFVITYLLVMGSGPPAGLLTWILQRIARFSDSSRKAIELVLRYTLAGVGILVLLLQAGLNTTTLAAIAGGLSVGLGFGIKEVFANFVSGLWLLFEGSIRPGEVLMLDGDPCEVRRLGLRATTLWRDRDNAELLIPNQTFFTQLATTYTGSDRMRRSEIRVRADFEHDPEVILNLLEQTALGTARVLQRPKPRALQVAYKESSIEYSLRYWIDNPMNNIGIISDVNQAIWKAFQQNGISIAYPRQVDYIRELPELMLSTQNQAQRTTSDAANPPLKRTEEDC